MSTNDSKNDLPGEPTSDRRDIGSGLIHVKWATGCENMGSQATHAKWASEREHTVTF